MTNKKKQVGFGTGAAVKTVPQPDSINFKTEAKINIMPVLKDQIDYLHHMVGNREWSGILFYTIKEGSISDIDNLSIEAHYVMPLDIGSGVSTEFDPDEATMDAFDMFENAEDMERGTIHTHHNMQAFFSSTDTNDLLEKVADDSHSYYLSLVVNIQEEYKAKIAVISKDSFTEYSINIGGTFHPVKVSNDKKVALTYETNVVLPPGKEVPRPFREQVEKIIKVAKQPQAPTRSNTRTDYYQDDYYNTEAYRKAYPQKKVFPYTLPEYSQPGKSKEIPGMGRGKRKKEQKEEVSELVSFKDPRGKMFVFADIITVDNEYGNIQEILECNSVEELLNIVTDSIDFFISDKSREYGKEQYCIQLKEHLIMRLFEQEKIVTANDIKDITNGLLKILLNVKECKIEATEEILTLLKATLTNMKAEAFIELNKYKTKIEKDLAWTK